jgi:hypothetical protein
MKEYKKNLSRKQFLQICSSAIAGGSILGVSGLLFRKNVIRHDVPGGKDRLITANIAGLQGDNFTSSYKLVSSFSVPDHIEAFELAGDNLIAATSNNIFIYDRTGHLLNRYVAGSNLRDIATDNDHIYLLFPTRIEVYNHDGKWLRGWEACSDRSDHCSMAVAPGFVFVTDAANKNICKYTTDGTFVKFIQSPNGFIIPSYSFGITYTNGIIYSSNSGRHRVEKYSLDGEYLGTFGKTGGATGMFCGCCNPVHLAYTSTGEIITSEKGNPRISCYSANGEFRSMLLDSKMLGGGNTAYDVKVHNDKLFIAGKNLISTFQYDNKLAAKTACSGCEVDCPLRT